MNFQDRTTLPAPDSDEELRARLNRVFAILAQPEHGLRSQAIELRQKVSFKWRDRAALGRWVSVSACAQGNVEYSTGMLSYLGYHVGETRPVAREIRHCILSYIVECHLPPLNDCAYFSQWGEPGTPARFRKLASTLKSLNQSAELRKDASCARSIRERNEDLDFLYTRNAHLNRPGMTVFLEH